MRIITYVQRTNVALTGHRANSSSLNYSEVTPEMLSDAKKRRIDSL